MAKKIKKHTGVPAIALPFPPTETPEHAQVAAAAKSILQLVQVCFLGNPAPVITALKAAEYVYTTNAEAAGFEQVEDFEVLGIHIAKEILKQLEEQKKKAASGIVTPDTRLVGPDGQPLPTAAPAPGSVLAGILEKMAAGSETAAESPAPEETPEAVEETPQLILDSNG